MTGFANGGSFMVLTAAQRQLAERLAEIEREDAEACANCSGEDCICCEIYRDRMRWQEPRSSSAILNIIGKEEPI